VQRVTPMQVISVDAGGSDLVEILFSGESLVQIDDGSARQIYRDIRVAGDHLRVSGTGPFNVLLGDAATAELHLNGKKIDFTESIRIDNSARLTIGL
jgi:cytoskeleton protein RodZ